jgi:hypothetical protein
MVKKREPIDDLIDALVWMRRQSSKQAGRDSISAKTPPQRQKI